jgi:hypothetical protein
MKVVIAICLALLGTLYLPAAQATDMPPNLRITGEYAAVSMFLADLLLQNPMLRDQLKQETRDWANAIEADAKARSNAAPAKPATFGRRYDVSSIIGDYRYFSIICTSGAADSDAIETVTILWSTAANKRITLAPFFQEIATGGPTMTMLLAEAAKGLAAEIDKDKDAKKPVPPREQLDPVSLAPSTIPGKSSGLNFHYAIPTNGKYAQTTMVVFVPWRKFRAFLSPQGRAIFAGRWRQRDLLQDN